MRVGFGNNGVARASIRVITLLLQAHYDSDIFMRPVSFMNYELPVVDLSCCFVSISCKL